ncbi:MAG: ABC transporter substrate-binding protein [Acidimicrobiales bacterium]
MPKRTSRRGAVALAVGAVALVATACTSGGAPAAKGSSSQGGSSAGSHGAASGGTTTSTAAGASSAALQCPAGTGTGAPGVTSSSIKIAAISTRTGPISADFNGLVPGLEAYFKTVDAKGGVNGRKITLAYDLDTAGLSTQFETATHTAIDQDHAFAVAVSSFWFSPTYFVSTCTPTYGYNINGNWTKAPNLFGATGSTQTYDTIDPAVAYLLDKSKAKSIGVLAYSVSTSNAVCKAAIKRLEGAGYDVAFTDLQLPPVNANVTPDVQRMQQAGVDFVLSCMTVTGNVSLARAVQQYGLHVKQLWFDGADQAVVSKYHSLLQGVYFNVQHVPVAAAKQNPENYPGSVAYLQAMKKYEPNFVGSELAVQGWESAALMVAGIKAAGKDLTQAAVVAATNHLVNFTAGGLIQPVSWATAHTTVSPVSCSAFEQVKGTSVVPALAKGKQVFLCFTTSRMRHPSPVPPPPGTPGT